MNQSTLRALYARPGPWASVYLDATHETEDASQLIALRWRGLNQRLEEAGTDAATRSAIAEEATATAQLPPGRFGLAVFATEGEIVLRRALPQPPAREEATWAPRPRVLPLLTALATTPTSGSVGWMRVTVDRTGADIEMDSGRYAVDGSETYPIHKSGQGGWSAPRYERATEVAWDRNARDVATAVTRMVDAHNPSVVILAGDVRARQLVYEHLPERVRWRSKGSSGSRAPGASERRLHEATESVAGQLAEQERQQVVERFHTEARRGAAVEGLADVVAAARSAALGNLLIDPERVRGSIWTDPAEPLVLADGEEELRALNVSGAVREPVGEALVAAAVCADAQITILRDGLDLVDGVGALVRFHS
ncbi:MAG TPA: Vms1/Ankzf1 family peptidyl-tRNA hydrolase [Micromonosporaceae bacterium]|nr:Vms1/Ankzf1 family peptidyl-tRNA hydrolase [Micromonosporaceae bacterium]